MRTHEIRLNPPLLLGLSFGLFLGLHLFGSDAMGQPTAAGGAESSTMEVRHLVGPGEDLHLLSAYYYGDARQWKKIYEANRSQIKNANRIHVKQVLRVEVPIGWKPSLPFSAWMEKVEGPAPAKEPSPSAAPEEKPSAEPSGEGKTSDSQ
jgi:hypothetical protein